MHYLMTRGTICQIPPFSFKIKCNLVLTKGVICQIALFQSTNDLNSIGYKGFLVTYDTCSSQRIENLPYGKKSNLQKGGIALYFKLNCFKLVSFQTIHSYTIFNINTKHLYCKSDFLGGCKSLNVFSQSIKSAHSTFYR